MIEQTELTELVECSRTGDRTAQETLVAAVHSFVFYHCYKMTRDREAALDLTQDVLLAMITQLPTLQKPASFRPWLLRILYNRCKNHLTRGPQECQIPETAEGGSILDTLPQEDICAQPDRALEQAETARILQGLLDNLPQEQRMCMLLYYYDELKVSEIASVLSVPGSTVKSRLRYGRRAMKKGIRDYVGRHGRFFSLALGPLLTPLFRSEAEAISTGNSMQYIPKLAAATLGTVWKAAACTVALGVTVGALWATRDLRKTKPPEETIQETSEVTLLSRQECNTVEAWLEQNDRFMDSLDAPGDPPAIDVGRCWYDEQGLLHAEYRVYSAVTSLLQEVVLEGEANQWQITSDGPAAGVYANGVPDGTVLSEESLRELEAWIWGEGGTMAPYVLTSDFRTPDDLSLFDLFRDGYCPDGVPVPLPESEVQKLLGRTSEVDVTSATAAEIDQVLLELTGVSSSETAQYGLEQFSQSDDRYYLEHALHSLDYPKLQSGWYQDDDMVCVLYEKNRTPYEICLRDVNGQLQFLSHRPVWQLEEVNETALADPLQLADSFVISQVLLPPELALIDPPFTFSTPEELTSDQLLKLFLLWTDYDQLEDCREADGNFYFREPLIRSTLNRYFKTYRFDITQCSSYDESSQAVVLGNASGFGGDRGIRIVKAQTVEETVVSYTVEFYDLYGGEDAPAQQQKIYTIEYYPGGWYYRSVVDVPLE